MSSVLADCTSEVAWQEFLGDRLEKGHLRSDDEARLREYIEERRYLGVLEQIQSGAGLGLPTKKLVNKLGKTKKRVVYTFPEDQANTLKLIAHLLYRFDNGQENGCYSFRRGFGAHSAIRHLTRTPNLAELWCYKLDIADYFNSIDIPTLLPILRGILVDDPELFAFFENMLTVDQAIFEDEVITENRGVMAGTSTAPFLANIYLGELDAHFVSLGIPYARYSDDIVVFAPTQEELNTHRAFILDLLDRYHLRVNPDKEHVSAPDESWEFLGINYQPDGNIDLGTATKAKLKGKIRRKARSLRRWLLRKDAAPERAMKAMIRIYNNKFFEARSAHDLTWSRWFFPLLTRDDSLKEIDRYLQQEIRYLATGTHSKANFRTSYETLRSLGYRTLVHAYHDWAAAEKRPRPTV
ncbi:MAG: hypothetical protein LBN10_08990 [Propionibacteriaceae bacterium]|jgi:hypothetical protein|nr:hypothetical protein [Propionibacteriaceae bacterium]